mgnify:CR=1 FL=1
MTLLLVLTVAVVVGSGLSAGILLGVAISVVPALREMPPEWYVYTHDVLGRRWDPVMPLLVLSTVAIDVVLAAAHEQLRPLFVAGAVLLAVVSAVSHWGNRPINRRIRAEDPATLPADWTDPRPP